MKFWSIQTVLTYIGNFLCKIQCLSSCGSTPAPKKWLAAFQLHRPLGKEACTWIRQNTNLPQCGANKCCLNDVHPSDEKKTLVTPHQASEPATENATQTRIRKTIALWFAAQLGSHNAKSSSAAANTMKTPRRCSEMTLSTAPSLADRLPFWSGAALHTFEFSTFYRASLTFYRASLWANLGHYVCSLHHAGTDTEIMITAGAEMKTFNAPDTATQTWVLQLAEGAVFCVWPNDPK